MVEVRGAYDRGRVVVRGRFHFGGSGARSIALAAAMIDGSLWLGAHDSQGFLSRQQDRRH
jgi:hypothetical protein